MSFVEIVIGTIDKNLFTEREWCSMVETQFINDRNLRDNNVEHYEVLEKVKSLILLPGTDLAILNQVADFYEVDEETVQTVYKRNKDELFLQEE